eukprot:760044-Hanusia_phi.AAC.7
MNNWSLLSQLSIPPSLPLARPQTQDTTNNTRTPAHTETHTCIVHTYTPPQALCSALLLVYPSFLLHHGLGSFGLPTPSTRLPVATTLTTPPGLNPLDPPL